jgi:hypothetical protein
VAITVTSVANSGTSGTLSNPGAVTASETISKAYVGKILKVSNASGGSINVTFTDPGTTPAGNTGTQAAAAVADGATRMWRLTRAFVGSDDLITVAFSATTSVTAEILS